jgi:cytochrome c-type biogenesis protein CcmH
LNDSNSDFAKDLKQVIKKKILEKKTNKEIYEYLTDRYGDWILFNPPLKKSTILLWAIPGLFFFLGAILLIKKTQLTTLNRDN